MHVDCVSNIIYNNSKDIKFWQGIRYLSDNYYITCGTTIDEQGVVNIGSITNYNSENNYTVTYPNSEVTSVYGPDYVGIGIYRLVGTYRNANDSTIFGFFFEGNLLDLNKPQNYNTLLIGTNSEYTYVHSAMGNLLGGTYGNGTDAINAFIMKIKTGEVIDVIYPNSKSNTVYGIWHNCDDSYTLCGGYSNEDVSAAKIYKDGQPTPFGNAYIVNYDIQTNQFTNWTSISDSNNKNILTHFEGISSSSPNNYELAADSINTELIINNNIGSYVKMVFDQYCYFSVSSWINIDYPQPLTITSSNSVANNIIVGAYFESDKESYGYSAEIQEEKMKNDYRGKKNKHKLFEDSNFDWIENYIKNNH